MLPALLVLLGGVVVVTVWRNQREVISLADTAIRGVFQGKRELEAMVRQLLDGNQSVEGNAEAVWVNVDRPTAKEMLHAEHCRYVRDKHETELKGIGELKRDGGWLPFESLDEARKAYPSAQLAEDGCWEPASAP